MKKLVGLGAIIAGVCMAVLGFVPGLTLGQDVTCDNLHVLQNSQLDGQLGIGPDIKIHEDVAENELHIDTGEIPGAGEDRRRIRIPCSDGGDIVISPTDSRIQKEGGDEWFSLGEESSFNSLVNVGHLSLEGNWPWDSPLWVNVWGPIGTWYRVARFYSPDIPVNNAVTLHLGKSDSDGNCAEITYFHAGNHSGYNRLQLGLHSNGGIINIERRGKVGIAMVPSYTLDVNGPIRASGAAYLNNNVFVPKGLAIGSYNTDPNYKLHVTGNALVTGHIYGSCDWAAEADWAESAGCAEEMCHMSERNYTTKADETFEDGDVVCLENGEIVKSKEKNSRAVRGVIEIKAGQPSVVVIGVYKIKVVGPVKANDLLVTSDFLGYAMVNNDAKIGTVIAKANEDFNGDKGVISCHIQNL